jgi:16S rRNA (cytosine967-C5)-methyltransferase
MNAMIDAKDSGAELGLFPSGAVSQAVFKHVLEALNVALKFTAPADAVLSKYFRDNRELGSRDRGWVAETVFAVLREKSTLQYLAELLSADLAAAGATETKRERSAEKTEHRPRRMALFALARGAGVDSIDKVVREPELSLIKKLAVMPNADLPRNVRLNMPPYAVTALDAQLGPERVDALMAALNQPAPLDLRVNPLKAQRDAVAAELATINMPCEPTAYSPMGLRVHGKPLVSVSKLFKDGAIEVQDEGSQLLALLVGAKRGEMVTDFCAGAGGKTLALGAQMRGTGRLYAFDVSVRRLEKLKPRLVRSGLQNVTTMAIESENDIRIKRLAGKMDRVLVDAPCSGLGTARRNPDLKWRQGERDIAELNVKQMAILVAAARLVKPGGRLVYATCSLLAAENDAIADAFAAAHPQFTELNAGELLAAQAVPIEPMQRLRLAPDTHGTDGFFAVAFERAAASQAA